MHEALVLAEVLGIICSDLRRGGILMVGEDSPDPKDPVYSETPITSSSLDKFHSGGTNRLANPASVLPRLHTRNVFFGPEEDLRVPTHWEKRDPQNQPDWDDWRIHPDEVVRLGVFLCESSQLLLNPHNRSFTGNKGCFEEHFAMGDQSLYRLTVYYWKINIAG